MPSAGVIESVCVFAPEEVNVIQLGSTKVRSNDVLSDLLGKVGGFSESDVAVVVIVCVCAIGLTGASSLSLEKVDVSSVREVAVSIFSSLTVRDVSE